MLFTVLKAWNTGVGDVEFIVGVLFLCDNILLYVGWGLNHGDYFIIICNLIPIKIKIKSVAYSSQGSHTGLLDFCNWLADGSTTG